MSETKTQSVILSKRWNHHTKSGGYDRLADEMRSDATIIQTNKSNRIPSFIKKRLFRKLRPSSKESNHYSLEDYLTERKAFKLTRNSTNNLIHALYGEDQLNLLLNQRKELHAALTGTFHLPPESPFISRIVKSGSIHRYSGLDSGIVVSRSMISDYENWIGKDRVYFVPHGIDTSIFHPGNSESDTRISSSGTLNVLIVGGHGRDWDLVNNVASIHEKNGGNISYTAVVPGKNTARKLAPHFTTLSDIKESELISLYRGADVLFIPVSYATANNSLLESLACGTPVISTDVGGIPDYLDDSCGWLIPKGDYRAAFELLSDLSNRRERVREKQQSARLKALSFDWANVADQVRQVHKYTLERWMKDGSNF